MAEAPSALDRYFYFEVVTTQDSLFRYVTRPILKEEPARENKAELLGRLRDRGIFVIDLWRDPSTFDPRRRTLQDSYDEFGSSLRRGSS